MAGYHERLYPVERTVGGVATGTGQYNAGGVGPHVATNRWSITTPTANAYQVESAMAVVMREVPAGAVGAAYVRIVAAGADLLYTPYNNNTAGAGASAYLGHCGFLLAGETIVGITADASTGGTHTLAASCHVRSFPI